MGKLNIGYGRGTHLRAFDEQTLVPPKRNRGIILSLLR